VKVKSIKGLGLLFSYNQKKGKWTKKFLLKGRIKVTFTRTWCTNVEKGEGKWLRRGRVSKFKVGISRRVKKTG